MSQLIVFLANYLVLLPVLLALATLVWQLSRGNFVAVLELLLETILAVVLFVIARHYIHGVRPYIVQNIPALIVHPPQSPSFPSGHTLIAFLAAFFALSYAPLVGIWATLAALLVGVGRILALVHWPIDVLGSVTIALVAVLVGKLMVNFGLSRGLDRANQTARRSAPRNPLN